MKLKLIVFDWWRLHTAKVDGEGDWILNSAAVGLSLAVVCVPAATACDSVVRIFGVR